jgi:hypothetical protein
LPILTKQEKPSNAQRPIPNAEAYLLQADAFKDRDETRIGAKRIPSWIDFEKRKPHIAIIARPLQLRESLVLISQPVID